MTAKIKDFKKAQYIKYIQNPSTTPIMMELEI